MQVSSCPTYIVHLVTQSTCFSQNEPVSTLELRFCTVCLDCGRLQTNWKSWFYLGKYREQEEGVVNWASFLCFLSTLWFEHFIPHLGIQFVCVCVGMSVGILLYSVE